MRQFAAAVAVLLFVASPLSEALHTLLVPHAICAEHGEVIHLQGATGASHAVAAEDAGTSLVSDVATSEASHEHCQVVAEQGRRLAAREATPLLLPLALDSADAEPTVGSRPLTSLDLMFLAPKTSPPARA